MVRFKWLTGDVNWLTYGGKWISNKQNNGEFDYWLVLEILNWEESVSERDAAEIGHKYNVQLSVVSPGQAGQKNIEAAQSCCGVDDEMLARAGDEGKVEILYSYGVHTPIFDKGGNNAHKLIREAKRYANQEASTLFGFLMDRPVNKIGTTGWESLRGDMDSAIKRAVGPEADIIRKMSGIESP